MIWQAQYSNGVELKKPLLNGELLFKFPARDGVHHIVKEVQGISGKYVRAEFTIKPSGATFESADGGTPQLRLFFQREGDDMSGSGEYQYYRYWSNPQSCILKPGKQVLSVSLKPDQWSDVQGKYAFLNPMAFRAALQGAQWLGFTFGGHFFAHGVWATNTAKFRLLSFNP